MISVTTFSIPTSLIWLAPEIECGEYTEMLTLAVTRKLPGKLRVNPGIDLRLLFLGPSRFS